MRDFNPNKRSADELLAETEVNQRKAQMAMLDKIEEVYEEESD